MTRPNCHSDAERRRDMDDAAALRELEAARRRKRIIDLRKAGESLSNICARLKVSPKMVDTVLREAGVLR